MRSLKFWCKALHPLSEWHWSERQKAIEVQVEKLSGVMHRQFEFYVVKEVGWPRRLQFLLPRLSIHHDNSSSLGVLGQRAQALSFLPVGATQATSWLGNACGLEKQPVLLASHWQECARHQPYYHSQAERTELKEAAQAFMLSWLCTPYFPAAGMLSLYPTTLLCLKISIHPSIPQIEVVSFPALS